LASSLIRCTIEECDSLEEAIDILDGGYGILELPEEKEVKREHEL